MKNTCRFAAGTKTGLKSSIWKVMVRNSDIYIFTKLFGSDAKISLHQSGSGQWSMTSEYIAKQHGMKNQERHIAKWTFAQPVGDVSYNIFRILIPHTELRNYTTDKIKNKVKWISGIKLGAYQIDFCLTRSSENNPCEGRQDLPHPVLDAQQLSDKRWLILFYQAVPLSPIDIENAKKSAVSEMIEKGIDMNGDRRIALFGKGDDDVPFIIELYYDSGLNKC